jgi:pyridoxine 5'-phosphate synthase PdxJ
MPFERIKNMATYAHSIGLQVNAGHGLTLENTRAIAQLPEIVELNIGAASIWSFCASINKETTTSEALSCAQTSVILEI